MLARAAAPEVMVKLGRSGPNIGACCRRVLLALGGRGGTFELAALLLTFPTRAERVITFIAVLEMSRLGWLDVDQREHVGPIRVEQLVEDEVIDVAKVTGEDTPGEQLELPLSELGDAEAG
ncbi:MAG: hypothetical protein ABMB14_04430 [Myxococcota bacterium]